VAVIALEVGDDTAALAVCHQLPQLLDEINDPFVHAVSRLAIAWALPITGEFDSALLAASAALNEFQLQDEPLWTAVAAGSLGWIELCVGHCDDALVHLRQFRDVADGFDSAWLDAWSRMQLATVAIMQGKLDQGHELLDEALALGEQAHSTRSVTLCLIAFARLALAEGDPEQAAMLAGAAEGMRRRVGLRSWPMVRQSEAELIEQIRNGLDPARFSKMTEVGSRLTRQQAVAAMWPRRGASGASVTDARRWGS